MPAIYCGLGNGRDTPEAEGNSLLSTIILNWNRSGLLRQTVESYTSTVSGRFELFVVDNASTDDSREFLRRVEADGLAKVLYLSQNIGGLAFNEVIPLTTGDLVHLSENDQIFLPGWFEHVTSSFQAFPGLGQLSLFSGVATDEEAWGEPEPSTLRFAKGKILYEVRDNLGTSSVLRASLLRERGLRIANIEGGAFKFPNDSKLSADVKAAGYWCAYSDRYYVRNVGHEVAEFETNSDYYQENYASKPWVGVAGWQERVARQKSRPKINRLSSVFPDRAAGPEKTPGDVFGKPARLWSMFDGFTAEAETLDFLHALIRLVKPRQVLETGTWLGLSSCAIGLALLSNGFGHVTTLEINQEAHATALENISHYKVQSVVTALLVPSTEFVPDCTYDLAVFDSELCLRTGEFRRFKASLSEHAVVVFHDTAPHHEKVGEGVRSLISEGLIEGVDLPTPRGIFIGRLKTKSRRLRGKPLSWPNLREAKKVLRKAKAAILPRILQPRVPSAQSLRGATAEEHLAQSMKPAAVARYE